MESAGYVLQPDRRWATLPRLWLRKIETPRHSAVGAGGLQPSTPVTASNDLDHHLDKSVKK